MNPQEWESLCDGCGRCCVHKLENEETGEVHYTNVACRLSDLDRCRCQSYQYRIVLIPNCTVLTPTKVEQFQWMPPTCAYRLLAEGKELAWWHPLISKDAGTVHDAGISVRGKVVSEQDIDPEDWENHVIETG